MGHRLFGGDSRVGRRRWRNGGAQKYQRCHSRHRHTASLSLDPLSGVHQGRIMPNTSIAASKVLDRVLVLEMVRVTEAAAISAAKLIGRGDEKAADAAAVEAMRGALNELPFDGTVVIGEGE